MQYFTGHGNRCVITVLVAAIITASNATLAAGIWEQRAPMPVANSEFAVAEANGEDFAVYDPAANTWEILPNLPSKSNHMAAAAIDGRLHVVGGRLGGSYRTPITAEHVIYDPENRVWVSGPPMPRPRSGINLPPMPFPVHGVTGAAFIDGMIFIPGGGDAVGGSSAESTDIHIP